jgi:sugar phosphate isomerase/epimerase
MMNRRVFLATTAAPLAAATTPGKMKLHVFSKHLQFLQGEALAEAAAEIGFDGIDLTVRPGGHVEPARVKEDLPGLVKTVRKRGLEAPMVTAGIVDADTPHAEAMLQTFAELGIRHYRWGGFRYAKNQPVGAQLEALKPRVAKLAKLNQKYGVGAMYHTHSGVGQVGASIWDIHAVVKEFDAAAVGINYDIGHATIEGGFGGWINSLSVCGNHLRGVALKDFVWERRGESDWRVKWTPVGEGMVRFAEFFRLLGKFVGPLQVHYEYPLGGADQGKTAITIPKEKVFAAMKADLVKLRTYL